MCANKFKVGDRVRVLHTDYPEEIPVGTITTVARIDGDGDVHLDGKTVRELFFYDHEIEPAPQQLTIRAGRFYRTRDGRKVGPMEAVCYGFTANERIDGIKRLWQGNGAHGATYVANDARLDIIAEWVDEPVFGIGDRVKFVDDYTSSSRGKEAIVIDAPPATWGFKVRQIESGNVSTEGAHSLRLVAPATTAQCIVALIENGQPLPSHRPFVHPDREAATKEARRLAGKHKGQEFGVYELVSSEKQDKVYEHEWQRLAASGQKVAAIKEVRTATGFTLKGAKDAVEHWLELNAA